MAKTILIVGGAGYIGSYVNKLLNQSGYHTVVFDNLSTGDRNNVTQGEFLQGDIGNREDLDKVFNEYQIDGVMHFAAHIEVGESVTNPEKYYYNNVINTCHLLKKMMEVGVNYFVFSSSAAIFGEAKKDQISEDHPKAPINPYGMTKLMIEEILKDYAAAYPLKSCCLRYFNAAGGDPEGEIMNRRTNQANLIPKAVLSLLSPQGSLKVFGTDYATPDGTCIRDYIHIHDLATAHLLGMENLFKENKFRCFNLGNGNGFSVLQVLDSLERISGQELNIVYADRREGDPQKLVADSSYAQEVLGWKPTHSSLDKIVGDAWKTMQQKNTFMV